jgi:hypothetical protein
MQYYGQSATVFTDSGELGSDMGAGLNRLRLLLPLIALGVAGCNDNGTSNQQKASANPPSPFAIAPQFTYASPFSEGLAVVQTGDEKTGKWGFIDKAGMSVIPAQFSLAQSFSDGLAAVLVGGLHGKWGFIDKQGHYVIDPQFDGVWSPGFVDGMARVEVRDLMVERKTCLIDKSGKFLLPPTFDYISEFSEGLAVGSFSNWDNKHWRSPKYIDTHGNLALVPIPKAVAAVGPFHNGLASASIRNGDTFRFGYIDRQGDFVIPPVYDFSLGFKDGYAQVGMGTLPSLSDGSARFGFINPKGEVTVPLHFSEVLDFSEGLAAVRIGDDKTGQWGFIAVDGKFILNPRFAEVSVFVDGLAPATEDGKKWGFINRSGAFVIAPTYDRANAFEDGYANVAIKHGDGFTWGVMNTKGRLVVQPISDELIKFSEGMAAVKVNGKFGYIKRPAS